MERKLNDNEVAIIYQKVNEILCNIPEYISGDYYSFISKTISSSDGFYYDDELGYYYRATANRGSIRFEYFGHSMNNILRICVMRYIGLKTVYFEAINYIEEVVKNGSSKFIPDEGLLKIPNITSFDKATQDSLTKFNYNCYCTSIVNKYLLDEYSDNYTPIPFEAVYMAMNKFIERLLQDSSVCFNYLHSDIRFMNSRLYYKDKNGYYRKRVLYSYTKHSSAEDESKYPPFEAEKINEMIFIGKTNVDLIREFMNYVIDGNSNEYVRTEISKNPNLDPNIDPMTCLVEELPDYNRLKAEYISNCHKIVNSYLEDDEFKQIINEIL